MHSPLSAEDEGGVDPLKGSLRGSQFLEESCREKKDGDFFQGEEGRAGGGGGVKFLKKK